MSTPETEAPQVILDEARLNSYLEAERANQNIGMAVLGGIIGALIGAIIWAVITYIFNYQHSLMAMGVGALTGLLVQFLGKGMDMPYGIIGALFSIVGCALGNLFALLIINAEATDMEIFQFLSIINLDELLMMIETWFQPIDILFYGLAAWIGYSLSFRNFSEEELAKFIKTE